MKRAKSEFRKAIEARRRKVKALWLGPGEMTVREIAKQVLERPEHDTIIRQDLKRLGFDPTAHKAKRLFGRKRKLVEAMLLEGRCAPEIVEAVGCVRRYVLAIARDLRAEGKLAPAPNRSELMEQRAALYAEDVRLLGSVEEVARKHGVTPTQIYNTLNGAGYSVLDLKAEGRAA